MSIYSDIAEGDKCQHCGAVLFGQCHIIGKRWVRDDDMDVLVYDVKCLQCGAVNAIEYIGEMQPSANMRRLMAEQQRRAGERWIAWAPAVGRHHKKL